MVVARESGHFPNGTAVGIRGDRTTGNLFFRDRDSEIVHLNSRGDPSERGHFRCEVPNAAGVMVTVYVNIGECHHHELRIVIAIYATLCYIPF